MQRRLEFRYHLPGTHNDSHTTPGPHRLFLANQFHRMPKQKIESLRYSQEHFERLHAISRYGMGYDTGVVSKISSRGYWPTLVNNIFDRVLINVRAFSPFKKEIILGIQLLH